ncbi:TetR/AcrR family transcriptional regulator [Mycobacteroides abscessus]|uniref:TetR family transcriptional regulator n=1 Tax=Mycobacteroides abscessus TaxID=36809 RepID=A0A0U0ZQT4_9MYCO|nr:TetR/AcrR family transcriptional regulator [Mycobacteroides abscessus]MBL3736035.1 TetR/AcrR family transcriptional regulator [Mycobacteroides abscessus subsp. massiliense]MBL3744710.1 TetR/AcrR family transcriptional regulator [Mycobacteroides abscessus subsp. massiliense]MBL3760717.1 TetR/AcrR family transcriptional regulator [Mycobacteroides abscessus subsp. massiliense]MBN7483661.1 TetR/AcrR family transcriptional regulator [Mycobacteroides abscessus subsp. massiliense]MDB2217425.1 TetR
MTPDDKQMTRTERQRRRTRRQLLDAGRTLIAAKGVPGLRIQEITDEADIALGSFYNYFDSKEAFLEAVITESLSELASAIIGNADNETDPAEVVALACLRVVRLAQTEPDFARLIVNISHSEAVFGGALHPHARVAVERGIDSGRFVVADVEVLLTTVIGGAFALIGQILDGKHGARAEHAFTRHALASLGVNPQEAEAVVTKLVDSEQL